MTGGSYLIKYAPNYNASNGSTIPVNGDANGNEKLSLFTLTDPSTSALKPLNKGGVAYDYSVAKPSSDGEKHVWVPAAKVTFKLNADDAAQKVSAAYADGSSDDQTALAMRGYAFEAAKSVAGDSVSLPSDPFAPGYKFLGWFYKDAAGNEKPFFASETISSDTTVYAKWEDKLVTVKLSANGGTFSNDSVFKKNPDVFDIAPDVNGGEVAVVKKQAKVSDNTILDALFKSLGDGLVTADTMGIKSPVNTNTDAAYTGIATKKYHVIASKDVPQTLFGWVIGYDYYY